MTPREKRPFRLAVVTAGTSEPSGTRMLTDRVARRVTELANRRGNEVTTQVIDLREMATDVKQV